MTGLEQLVSRYRVSSEPLRSERRLELFALALLLLLLVQLVALAWSALADGVVTPVLPAADGMRVAEPIGTGSISATESTAVQARPLFWQSRRAIAGAVAGTESTVVERATTAGPKLKQLSVTGVFGAGADGGVIATYQGRQERWLTGEAIDGWVLESVAPGEAVFVKAGVRDVRRLLPQPVVRDAVEAAESVPPAGAAVTEESAPQPVNSSVARPQRSASSVARPARPGSRDG